MVGALDGTVHITSSTGENRLIQRHGAEVSAVATGETDDGLVVVSASHDGIVHWTPVNTMAPAASMHIGEQITAMAISPTGWIALATPGRDGAIVGWSPSNTA